MRLIHVSSVAGLRCEANLLRLMVSSLCPAVYGHELVKTALVLALMSGCAKEDRQSPHLTVRGAIHVLLFGDHGSHKDLLLKSVHSCAPKGHYLFGNASTINSLTTRYVKTKTKEYFEKGSLVSDPLVICCIDDFERLNTVQRQAVQEVLEHQNLWISRKEKLQRLSANTCIIAAVNPIDGAFDRTVNVWQNTRLSASLLNKFDLIFDLIDTPDEELDSKLSKDILDSHKPSTSGHKLLQKFCEQTLITTRNDCNLMSKLIFRATEDEPNLIPHESMRQYVDYAHKFIQPVINCRANELLIDFCQQMAPSEISRSVTRNLETLYRLTEARARVELRSVATEEDALDVIDIVRHSIGKHYVLPNLVNSVKIVHSFRGSSKRQNTKNLLKALQIFSEQNQQKVFSVDQIVDISSHFQIPFDSREEILVAIDRLNNESHVIKTGSDYKLL
ncbi:unnamed protein product, partial [Oppiella nova]